MLNRILSKLLDYPDDGLQGVLWEIRMRARSGDEFLAHERAVVETFVNYLESMTLTELQAAYVKTFDMTPEHSLHMTHHLFGDDKNRGPALIDLTEFYKEYGLEMAANDGKVEELPDYLPLMLEFGSQLDPDEARMFFSKWLKVFTQLALNLEKAESPYAPLIRIIETRSQLVKAA